MYSQFQSSYQRVESSLQKLTDSIAAYSNSQSAANELVEADAAVSEHLEQLIIHQKNLVRLVDLRQASNSLDETIRNTVRLLADTRKELQAIPATDNTSDRREVKVDELLQYAKFIAPTTVPPTFRKPLPEELQPKGKTSEATTPHITNGIATPPQNAQEPDSNPPFTRSGDTSAAVKTMDPTTKAWLVPENLPFDPWPSPQKMQEGALGEIQRMIDRGEDPGMVLSAEERAAEEKRKAEMEEEEKNMEEQREKERKAVFGNYEGGRRGTVVEAFNPDDL